MAKLMGVFGNFSLQMSRKENTCLLYDITRMRNVNIKLNKVQTFASEEKYPLGSVIYVLRKMTKEIPR